MLEFLKNELKKQDSMAVALINLSHNSNLSQLSQLVLKQKILLESLIFEIEHSSSAQPHTDMQTKILSYYNDYLQQQRLLVSMGFKTYLPNLEPMPYKMHNENSGKLHFDNQANFLLAPDNYNHQQREAGINALPKVATKPQSIRKDSVSKLPSFFSHQPEHVFRTPKQSDVVPVSKEFTTNNKETGHRVKKLKKSMGSEKKELKTPNSQEKSRSQEKLVKSRNAAREFRKRQIARADNLNHKVDALQNEEQELIHKIENLRMENNELRKRQQFLRNFLLNALPPKVLETTEEPSLNNQFNIKG